MLAVGTLLGLHPLLTGTDPMAFFSPCAAWVLAAVAAVDAQRGRERRARTLFALCLVSYIAVLMVFAPPILKLTLGFPLACLTVFLFHLVFPPEPATRLGNAILGTVVVGYVAYAAVDFGRFLHWRVLTSFAAQTLALVFSNFVLGRLGSGWVEALAEARQARAQLSAAYELALQASKAKSTFLASMSHELRTPLNAVIGYAELAEDDLVDLGTAHHEDLQRIQRAGKHLLDLVNQVLDLSRIEAGKIELDRTPVNLGDLAREVCDTLRPQIQRNRNRLVVRVADVPQISLDALRARQIVTNLVGNAAKFTQDGTIDVAVETRDDGVAVVVTDDGPGIPADGVDKIFAPFEQATSTIQRTHGGTGLGLAISRQLAHEMGGALSARSAIGEGASFTLYFPTNPEAKQLDLPSAA